MHLKMSLMSFDLIWKECSWVSQTEKVPRWHNNSEARDFVHQQDTE